MRPAFGAALLGIMLSGCATSPYNLGTAAMQRGAYTEAEQRLNQAIREGDSPGSAWNNLGVVYVNMRQDAKALACYRMAARYGNPVGQQNLIALGQPVPTADLAQSTEQGMSGAEVLLLLTGSALDGYNKGRQSRPVVLPNPVAAPSKAVNCTSTTVGTTTRTTCQ